MTRPQKLITFVECAILKTPTLCRGRAGTLSCTWPARSSRCVCRCSGWGSQELLRRLRPVASTARGRWATSGGRPAGGTPASSTETWTHARTSDVFGFTQYIHVVLYRVWHELVCRLVLVCWLVSVRTDWRRAESSWAAAARGSWRPRAASRNTCSSSHPRSRTSCRSLCLCAWRTVSATFWTKTHNNV